MTHPPITYVSRHAVSAGHSLAAAAGRLAVAGRVTRRRVPHAPGGSRDPGLDWPAGSAEVVRTDPAGAMMAAEVVPGRPAYPVAF